MKVNGRMICQKVTDVNSFQMDQSMKVNGKQGSFTAKEFKKMEKVTHMKVIGSKVRKKV